MGYVKYILLTLVISSIYPVITGCDAPRDNPLDPRNPNFKPSPTEDHITEFINPTLITARIAANLPDPERLHAIVSSEIFDGDGIDIVYLEIADTILYLMEFDKQTGRFVFEFKPENIEKSLIRFVGTPFYIVVNDRVGFVTKSEKLMISRILAESPELKYPKSPFGITGANPTLIWSKYNEKFEFTYRVQVRSDAGLVWFSRYELEPEEPVPGDLEDLDSVKVDIVLAEGNYRWNVWVEDHLGNQSISRTNLFKVVNP